MAAPTLLTWQISEPGHQHDPFSYDLPGLLLNPGAGGPSIAIAATRQSTIAGSYADLYLSHDGTEAGLFALFQRYAHGDFLDPYKYAIYWCAFNAGASDEIWLCRGGTAPPAENVGVYIAQFDSYLEASASGVFNPNNGYGMLTTGQTQIPHCAFGVPADSTGFVACSANSAASGGHSLNNLHVVEANLESSVLRDNPGTFVLPGPFWSGHVDPEPFVQTVIWVTNTRTPTPPTPGTQKPPLRLRRRNDGKMAPRVNHAGFNQSTSKQTGRNSANYNRYI